MTWSSKSVHVATSPRSAQVIMPPRWTSATGPGAIVATPAAHGAVVEDRAAAQAPDRDAAHVDVRGQACRDDLLGGPLHARRLGAVGLEAVADHAAPALSPAVHAAVVAERAAMRER